MYNFSYFERKLLDRFVKIAFEMSRGTFCQELNEILEKIFRIRARVFWNLINKSFW